MSTMHGESPPLSSRVGLDQQRQSKPSACAGLGTNGPLKKKLVIKAFKKPPQLPDNFYELTWQRLKTAVDAVNTKRSVDISKEVLYRDVEDLCIHKLSWKLYNDLKTECERHIQNKIQTLIDQTPDHTAFLSVVDSVWQDHCSHMLTIRNIFLHLDRTYALQTPGLLSIWDLGLQIFGSELRARYEVEQKLVLGLLWMVHCERNGTHINRDVLKRLLRMLTALNTYKDRFENIFLEDSERFFTAEGQKLLAEMDTAQFLIHVESRLQQASEMVINYLDLSSKKPLVLVIESKLLMPHTQALVDRGLEGLLSSDRVSDISLMFSLFERVHATDLLREGLNSYIRKKGTEIVSDASRDKEMVEDLLVFQERMDAVIEKAFQNNGVFRRTCQMAFEHFINIRHNKPAELIARFLDRKLRGEKGVSDDEVEALLERIIILFKYLQEKDVFEAFYKKTLSKRLLLSKSASFDLERSMISKLKTECGSNFTAKLEGMFKDIDLSRDVMAQYSQHISERPLPTGLTRHIDCTFQVLTAGYWPGYPILEVVLPPELQTYREHFNAYYTNKFQGRRLMWQHSLDRCVLTARFSRCKKELELSFFQAIVLLCFNNMQMPALSTTELQQQTHLEVNELKRTLQSLACGVIGTRVLTKIPKGKDINDADSFKVNDDFNNKLYRIRINTIQLKETTEETIKTHEEVFRDRQYQVDAAIVRIMKARKTLAHTMLISELLTQLKFPATTSDLKRRIEALIEREYLERDMADSTLYNYLA